MNYKLTVFVVGNFLKYLGLLLLVPAIVALIYREGDFSVFVITGVITIISGLLLETITKEASKYKRINRKEAFLIVLFCWISACLYGSIPYIIHNVFSNPIDSIFESVAGFTTTGASVLTDIESLPRGMLFYRCFSQWLGGMGIIVLAIAVLPKLSIGGMQLMGLESSGPETEKITPKISETAKKLWTLYVGLSIVFMAILFICGMPLYDSIVASFSTLAIGGFSIKNASIGAYDSVLIEGFTTFFMFLAGINFVLLYSLCIKKFSNLKNNTELKAYIVIVILSIVFVTINLWGDTYEGFFESLRYSSFQVVSILTTTGFSSADSDVWPQSIKILLFSLMFIGGCAGSTAGSVKVVRIVILFKKCFRQVKHIIKPLVILPIRLNKKVISDEILSSVTSFFVLYVFVFALSVVVLLSIENISFFGAISACAAILGNVGPGFGEVGVTQNYYFLSGKTKIFFCFLMLLGRLELYTFLVILTPMFWKK
ncbi:MAG: TrkH family potassium uptake protein [Candidatus Dadabacteria bacterium]|nr:TrkH family potassium uptake protein [Candidatus Dadabacteria bacterium]